MNTFSYAGMNLVPIKEKPRGSFSAVTRRCRSVGIGNYPWSKTPYNYNEFYKLAAAVGGSDSDLFRCVETGIVYLPCENELMQYKKE